MPDKDLAQTFHTLSSWNFWRDIFDEVANVLGSAIGQVLRGYWQSSKVYVISFIFLFFIIKFWEKGIGSVVYHIIYFSILGCIIWAKGWAIIFNDFFEIISLFSYIISFWLAKIILVKTGIWKR